MIICVAGKNDIAVAIAEHIHTVMPGTELLVCLNSNDAGQDTWQKSLKAFAERNRIPIVTLDSLYKISGLFFFSLEFDHIIKPNHFKTTNLFNIHFSLLPEYKGMYTSMWPILEGKNYSGVTLHKIDHGIDTGDIIANKKFSIEPIDRARDLYRKYTYYGKQLFIEWLPKLIKGKFKAQPQSPRMSSYKSKTSIDFSNLRIDLNQTAQSILNQIRSYCFREYQMPELLGKKICGSSISTQRSLVKPGTLIEENAHMFKLATVDYDLEIYKDRYDELISACKSGDWRLVEIIGQEVMYADDTDKTGTSPVHYLKQAGKFGLAGMLKCKGALS